MTGSPGPLAGAIIAAGDGSRLRDAGVALPKPLVPINGVPLVEGVIRNFLAADVTSLVIILNAQHATCVEWIRARFPDLAIRFLVKTTASSLESFGEVAAARTGAPLLVSTVDAWCRPRDFARFVRAARARPAGSTVLALTPVVADETPLWVDVDRTGRVTAVGRGPGPLVTAGVYLFSADALALGVPTGLGRLRHYLAWLAAQGTPMYGEVIPTVVDVDRREDIALAETLARASVHAGGGA
jgi:NDP-sugar pyrophosphorylase family protein